MRQLEAISAGLGRGLSTVNMRLGVHIKGVDCSIYANNLNNAQPLVSMLSGGVTAVSDSLRYSGITFQPKTIGAQANYRF